MALNKSTLEQVILNELLAFDNESSKQDRLSIEQKDWFVSNWARILRLASCKMVKGQREHGGNFFRDVDHLTEADNEIVDLVHYIGGAKHNNVIRKDRL